MEAQERVNLEMDLTDYKKLAAMLESATPSKRKAKAAARSGQLKCVECGKKKRGQYKRCDDCRPAYIAWQKKNNAGKSAGKNVYGYQYAYDKDGNHGLAHRQIMEAALGRKLAKHESVIFYDGDKDNLDISNLVLTLKKGFPLKDLICQCCGNPYVTSSHQSYLEGPSVASSDQKPLSLTEPSLSLGTPSTSPSQQKSEHPSSSSQNLTSGEVRRVKHPPSNVQS
jgi:hypothetical protein